MVRTLRKHNHRAHGVRARRARTPAEVPAQITADTAEDAKTSQRSRKARRREKQQDRPVTARDVKRMIGIAKIVIPVAAPFVLKALGWLRARFDEMRARRLGIPVGDLARFSGRGAALHARIAGIDDVLGELRERAHGKTDQDSIAAERFADTARQRLTELTSVVRAAERMPAPRRRAAHQAVAAELDRIDDGLLDHLGVEHPAVAGTGRRHRGKHRPDQPLPGVDTSDS